MVVEADTAEVLDMVGGGCWGTKSSARSIGCAKSNASSIDFTGVKKGDIGVNKINHMIPVVKMLLSLIKHLKLRECFA